MKISKEVWDFMNKPQKVQFITACVDNTLCNEIEIIYPHNCLAEEVLDALDRQEEMLMEILMTQADLAVQLNAAADQAAKVNGEILALLAVIATEDEVSPELQAAADRVSAAIQANDDLNADAPVVVPE